MNNINSIKIRTKIFMMVFVLYTSIGLICTWSEYQNLFNPTLGRIYYISQIIIIPILFISFMGSRPTIIEFISFIFCGFVGVLTAITTKNPRFLLFVLLFFGARKINYDYVFKYNLIVNIFVFIFIIISSFLNILPNITLERDLGVYRQSLGFSAPNLLILAFMIIVMQIIIVKRKEIPLSLIILLLAISFWLGNISDGRGGEYSIILGLILTTILKYCPSKKVDTFFSKRAVRIFMTTLPEFLFVFMLCLIISVPYGSNLYNKLNTIFSFRFDISHFYFESLGTHLWPVRPVNTYVYPWFNGINNATAPMIDNLYMYLFCFLGLVATLIYLIMYSTLIKNALVNKDYWLIIVLVVFLFLGFVESQMVTAFVGIYVITYSNYKYKKYDS